MFLMWKQIIKELQKLLCLDFHSILSRPLPCVYNLTIINQVTFIIFSVKCIHFRSMHWIFDSIYIYIGLITTLNCVGFVLFIYCLKLPESLFFSYAKPCADKLVVGCKVFIAGLIVNTKLNLLESEGIHSCSPDDNDEINFIFLFCIVFLLIFCFTL